MKKFNISLYLLLALAILISGISCRSRSEDSPVSDSTANAPQQAIPVGERNGSLPNITILATGGTIAGTAASSTQAGYTSGMVTIDAMVNAVPDAKKIANISGEQVSNVGSQDMTFDIMLKLGKRINTLAQSNDLTGIVVT
ncbi:MAG TPA: asparaginase domain-containing protein, partial [Puia sp.]|nr:asparaginase domain-containing protein [Puia sp.]